VAGTGRWWRGYRPAWRGVWFANYLAPCRFGGAVGDCRPRVLAECARRPVSGRELRRLTGVYRGVLASFSRADAVASTTVEPGKRRSSTWRAHCYGARGGQRSSGCDVYAAGKRVTDSCSWVSRRPSFIATWRPAWPNRRAAGGYQAETLDFRRAAAVFGASGVAAARTRNSWRGRF